MPALAKIPTLKSTVDKLAQELLPFTEASFARTHDDLGAAVYVEFVDDDGDIVPYRALVYTELCDDPLLSPLDDWIKNRVFAPGSSGGIRPVPECFSAGVAGKAHSRRADGCDSPAARNARSGSMLPHVGLYANAEVTSTVMDRGGVQKRRECGQQKSFDHVRDGSSIE